MFVKQIELQEALGLAARGKEVKVLVMNLHEGTICRVIRELKEEGKMNETTGEVNSGTTQRD